MIHWAHNGVVRALVTPLIIRRLFHVPFYTEYSEKAEHQTASFITLCVVLVQFQPFQLLQTVRR